jgi:hypothetical protein
MKGWEQKRQVGTLVYAEVTGLGATYQPCTHSWTWLMMLVLMLLVKNRKCS